MSLRGELVVECDVPDCHAEQVVPASDLLGQDLVALCLREGWGGHVVTNTVVPGWTVRDGAPFRYERD